MSGVIVERLDQVLITGGRCPPLRAFSTALVMPLSMNGPFLTERAMNHSNMGPIGLMLTSSCDPSGSSSAFACCCASCNRESAGPRALPDYVHPRSCLHHHRAGGPPDSSPHHGL